MILIGIALLHVLLLLVLRVAMQPAKFAPTHEVAPLQITFIRLKRAIAIPRPIAAEPSVPHPRATSMPHRLAPPSDALQAVAIAPPSVPSPAVVESPNAVLYSADGRLLVPVAPTSSPPRDLLAHRDASWMIPGAPRSDSVDFHVQPGLAPRDVVNKAGRILSGLIGSAGSDPPGSNPMIPVTADRGLRTSGRDTDPCEDIALTEVDLNASATVVEQAEERDARHCGGH